MNKLLLALMLMLGATICMTGCNENPKTDKGKQDSVALAPTGKAKQDEDGDATAPTDKAKQERQDQPITSPDASPRREQPTLFIEAMKYSLADHNSKPPATPDMQPVIGQEHEAKLTEPVVGQNSNAKFVGRFLMRFSGAGNGSTSWHFTEDHKAIENGNEMGTWQQDGDNVVISYHNKKFGTAELTYKGDNKLVGQNRWPNGKVYDWVVERMPTPPNITRDLIDMMDNHLVGVNLDNIIVDRSGPRFASPQFLVEIYPLPVDKTRITPFYIPAGLVFRPVDDKNQNIVTIKSVYVDGLTNKKRVPVSVCCANQEKMFDVHGKYKKVERLPTEEPIRKLCVELSYSPLPWGECQQRIWNLARTCPLKR